ncbi:hypothetical protein [uncultured Brachyspira sp.]|uniref:hypothetical protein n=1 Tax=uncultured Brachyspira sp. TaxID=221953 RepID=UPI0025CEF4B0|nr:hypothetical protein [uncultured Brachyspira sp.]
MKRIFIIIYITAMLFFSCSSIKTYRDDLKGATRYYTDDFVEWGVFLDIAVYDNKPDMPIIALRVRTRGLYNYINLREICFFDKISRENIFFKLDKSENDIIFIDGHFSGSTYISPKVYKIAKGIKILNNKELDLLYDFMTSSSKPYIRFYGNFQDDNYLPSGQQKNIIKLIDKYRTEIKKN